MRSLCVFCGSGSGTDPAYADAARRVGEEIARRGWTLVYGGGRVGLMGIVASAALGAGAEVIGVIPRFLYELEVGHDGLTSLEIVESFAERKQRMGELADGFVSLPGGVGTMDEFFEAWSWSQVRLQEKPNGLLNVRGYYDELLAYIDRATREGFIRQATRRWLLVDSDPVALLDALADWRPD